MTAAINGDFDAPFRRLKKDTRFAGAPSTINSVCAEFRSDRRLCRAPERSWRSTFSGESGLCSETPRPWQAASSGLIGPSM